MFMECLDHKPIRSSCEKKLVYYNASDVMIMPDADFCDNAGTFSLFLLHAE